MIIAALILNLASLQIAHAVSEPQISIAGPDSEGITSIGVCITNPSEAIGSYVRFSSDYLGSGSFLVHSGTPACPSFGGVVIGQRLTSGQTYTFTASVTVSGQTFNISRSYTAPGEDPAVVAARQLKAAQDSDFRARQEAARAAAEAESKAWNAANPGKQKCVQWGPIVHANGVSTASGGACANPVDPGPNTTVPTQSAPSVEAPATTSPTTSSSANTNGGSSGASTDTSTTTTQSSSTNTSSSASTTSTTSSPVEDFSKWGSGTPYTRVLKGQLSTAECPSGFQAANGLIVAIGTGTFTECWPENAWSAYRLGGTVWEQFKTSGGTYDAKAEADRRNKVTELKALAKSVAQTAADQTPGIQRCSKWSGYGESGEECAYTFVAPTGSTGTTSSTNTQPGTSANNQSTETSTSTTSSAGSTNTTSSSSNSSSDPFPSLKNGEEIPNSRITSSPGITQSQWEQSSIYKAHTCPSGSGKASGVDLNFTISQNDDKWFVYCVKSFQSSTQTNVNSTVETSTTLAGNNSAGSSETNTATTNSTGTSSSTSSTSSVSNSESQTVTTQSSSTQTSTTTATTGPQGSSTGGSQNSASESATPTLQTTAIQLSGSVSELKSLVGKVVEDKKEARTISSLINRLDGVISRTSVKSIKLPGSSQVDETAISKTPNICTVSGVTVSSLSKGNCLIAYTVTDSDGNTFTTEKEIFFRK